MTPQSNTPAREGRLEVIVGPMFAGKTEELIRKVKRAVIAKQKVIVYKPRNDFRYGPDTVVSHSATDLEDTTGIKPKPVSPDLSDLVLEDHDVIAFDEVQFFSEGLIEVIGWLVMDGKRVICAGLDLDRDGIPFGLKPKENKLGVVSQLLAFADEVTKLTAVCSVCQGPASRSYWLGDDSSDKEDDESRIGGEDKYQARCKKCWVLDS